MNINQPRPINSLKPFRSKAKQYKDRGWDNPIYLPAKQKEPPPDGYTGKPDPITGKGKDVSWEKLNEWLKDSITERSNIALHLGNPVFVNGVQYETLGIDVDENNDRPDKPKHGGNQLRHMESQLGPLPDTWISSARDNGIAGIRFFLVPPKLEWRGNCSEGGGPHIDIVCLSHKYSAVYPSWHPTQGQYLWYPPGFKPSGLDSLSEIDWAALGYDISGDVCAVPKADTMAILPDKWVEFLSRGRTEFQGALPFEMNMSVPELQLWAEKEFVDGRGEPCKMMRDALNARIVDVQQSADHHYPLQEGHWNLLHLGSEGHAGWLTAVKEMEKVWLQRISDEGRASDRSTSKAKRELNRSREGALRKIKGKSDDLGKQGYTFVSKVETCYEPPKGVETKEIPGKIPHWVDRVIFDDQPDPADYEKNDTSQAKHFIDVFGSSVRYLKDWNAWVVYDGQTWHIDEYGSVAHLFNRGCMERSKDRILELIKLMKSHISQGGLQTDDTFKKLEGKFKKLKGIYDTYTNVAKSEAVLKRAGQTPEVSMDYAKLNPDLYIVAMPDGKIIRLAQRTKSEANNTVSQGFTIEDNKREYYTTMSTSVSYLPLQDIPKSELKEWQNTLDLLMPDRSYQKQVRKVMGYGLIGGNPEKRIFFFAGKPHTGKSTLVNAFGVMGDYSAPFNPSNVLEDNGKGGPNPELADHFFHRAITASEAGKAKLHADMLKRVAGRDSTTVRRLYSNKQIKGIAHFKIYLATNSPPTIIGEDKATRNRIMALPFDIPVPAGVDDKSATERLARECPHAILFWLLLGYRDYVREGLDEDTWHPYVLMKTKEFVNELSDVGAFLNDICEIAPDELREKYTKISISNDEEDELTEWAQITCNNLHGLYKKYVGEGERHLGIRSFNSFIRGQGLEDKVRRHGLNTGLTWLGLKLRAERVAEINGPQRI